jgi:aminoglycoside 6'-N-acetyltransferase
MSERRPPDTHADGFNLRFRPATMDDVPLLDRWDQDPAVIASTTDDPNADKAFKDAYWPAEIRSQDAYNAYLIAEIDGQPIGAMQVIDPHLESTHYWGDIEPNLRAIDIWIGEPEYRGKGFGAHMMRAVIEGCFADPGVKAIIIDPLNSNTRAHKFYQLLGFRPTHRQTFNDGEDDCLVHRLTREDWRAQNPETP